ncbi:unnamed protein product [Gadus morhua 'NCC']
MDEIRPLLDNSPAEGADVPHLNLRPRHQELIPTPCGPIKPWAELSRAVQLYFCFTLASMCVLLGLTLASFFGQYDALLEQDLGVSLIQLVGILFCVVLRGAGILQENRQELCAFLLSVLTLVLRSVLNYSLLPQEEQKKANVEVCVHTVCSAVLVYLDEIGERSHEPQDSILIGCALFWSCLTTAVGVVALLKEARKWPFSSISCSRSSAGGWADSGGPHTLKAASVVGALLAVGIKMALLGALGRLDKHFRQGLRPGEPGAAG